jgi:hypothetical protein
MKRVTRALTIHYSIERPTKSNLPVVHFLYPGSVMDYILRYERKNTKWVENLSNYWIIE